MLNIFLTFFLTMITMFLMDSLTNTTEESIYLIYNFLSLTSLVFTVTFDLAE